MNYTLLSTKDDISQHQVAYQMLQSTLTENLELYAQ